MPTIKMAARSLIWPHESLLQLDGATSRARASERSTEWPKKSANLEHSLVLTGIFIFKPARQFAERYHSVVNFALNIE
jgi:hypothetical protein